MAILNTEIVGKDSPVWVGFQHFFLFIVSFLVFSLVLQLLGLPFGNFFGFFFADFWQGLRLIAVAGFFAMLVSSMILRKKILSAENPNRVVIMSLIYFTLLQVWISYSPYFGYFEDATTRYEVSGKDYFFEQPTWLLVYMGAYYFTAKMFLKWKGSNEPSLKQVMLWITLIIALLWIGGYFFVYLSELSA
ncbi:MAG: hypothetical protein A2937_04085 [Candidatus Yonathbacteria bacterium RIFCSPLOWO2_01_FULL_47_33b]|uniref:Uncharacterized protein n=1 Tax=Candidatus Yonathbacteria bacterium RIFCSPLOWO2_01_FULL_47_33b TaxID=1802727 RepID=A0A1G2SFS2_9BACT|nr:MAG: hypothetical protein A2937_04085 [Candidatus Yonathbacteria bacterium RIFCSPLOWO2_01_FULL_47_33b]